MTSCFVYCMKSRFALISAVCVLPAACAPNPPIAAMAAAEAIRVVSNVPASSVTKDFGELTAVTCSRYVTETSTADVQAAIAELKAKALAAGANAVADLKTRPSGMNLGENCWTGVTATGRALLIR